MNTLEISEQTKLHNFKEIPGYNGEYLINESGVVLSTKYMNTKKTVPLKICKGHRDYLVCILCFNGVAKTIPIHRLVALTFLGECKKGDSVDHIDSNKNNNHISNLQYLSQRDNTIKHYKEKNGVVGVRMIGSGKYIARLVKNGKRKHLGTFETQELAINAYNREVNTTWN